AFSTSNYLALHTPIPLAPCTTLIGSSLTPVPAAFAALAPPAALLVSAPLARLGATLTHVRAALADIGAASTTLVRAPLARLGATLAHVRAARARVRTTGATLVDVRTTRPALVRRTTGATPAAILAAGIRFARGAARAAERHVLRATHT